MTTKLGIRLVAAYHYLGGVVCILMALIVAFIAITTLTTSSDTPLDTIILILVAVVCAIFAAIFFKIARLTRDLQPNGWWAVMILNAVFLLAADPLAAVILLYMYIMRRDFGIERGFTEMGGTEDLIRKLTGILASLAVFPGLGQIAVGRIRLGLKITGAMIACLLVMIAAAIVMGFWLDMVGLTFAVVILGLIVMIVTYVYALVDVIIGDVVPFGGEEDEEG